MTKTTLRSAMRHLATAALCAGVTLGAHAVPIAYVFNQPDFQSFDSGTPVPAGSVSGVFVGEDGVGGSLDGYLTSDEVTFLSLTYTSLVPSVPGFTLTLADTSVLFIAYLLSGGPALGDDPFEGIAAVGTGSSYVTGIAFGLQDVGFVINGGSSASAAPVLVQSVALIPEPQTYALMLGGLAVSALALQRRRRRD